MYWAICNSADRKGSLRYKSAKWKKRFRKSCIGRTVDRLATIIDDVTTQIDRVVTWAIGSEPTYKERMTWNKATFKNQRRVRHDRSSGQGYSKRKLGTSEWQRTSAIVCLLATAGTTHATRFDSDSVVLHVDNCASRCITPSIDDFVTAPRKVIGRVRGMGGDRVAVSAVGTIRWTFDDDAGMSHAFLIPGSLYIPDSPARLFSPQHWAQERKDNFPKRNGTWQATFADHVKLVWGQERFSRRIPLDKSNVATFSTTAGCKNFRVFQACIEATDDKDPDERPFTAFDATLIEDDEDDFPTDPTASEETTDNDASIIPVQQPGRLQGQKDIEENEDPGYSRTTGNHNTSYDKYTATIENEVDDEFDGKLKPTTELMLWHYRLGHVPLFATPNDGQDGPAAKATRRLPGTEVCGLHLRKNDSKGKTIKER
jgi:hypothetical protein